jgi:multiple sugar transport system substrate-binding protein
MHNARSRRATATAGGAAALAAVLMAGCAGPNAGPGTTAEADPADWGEPTGTVTFWDTNANPVTSAKWEELIGQFESANPDVDVEYVGLPNSSYLQKVDNALATGEVPDVLLIGNDIANFIAQGALTPLDDAYEESGLLEQIDPTMIEGVRQTSPDDKIYGAPLSALSDVIWYRTDWLREAGLPEPTSYDEFFDIAEQMTDQSANRFGYAFRGGPGSIPPLFAMTFGMSGVSEFFTEDGQATLDDPANVEAMKRYVSLYGTVSAPADLTNDYAKIVAAFDGGSAWATHHNLGSYQDHVKALGPENVAGVQPFPDEDGVVTATTPAISGLAIMEQSENKAAAWEFVEWMSTEGSSAWVETVGQVPANLETQKEPWVSQAQPLQAIVEVAEQPSTQYVRLPTHLPDWAAICKTEMEPDLQNVLQGGMSVEDFTAKYAARFEEALAEYEEFVAD